MPARRSFLIGGLLVSASALYSYRRGLRYPRLGLEPHALPDHLQTPAAQFKLSNLITAQSTSTPYFRAIAPEPSMTLTVEPGTVRFNVNNISTQATLTVTGTDVKQVSEEVNGITRQIAVTAHSTQSLKLDWQLPVSDGFDFAVIGDTGGGAELSWSITRAQQLGALFLLHLGDFNYAAGEYQQAIETFHASPIPCYISIGNHDFNDSGLVYKRFRQNLGVFNHAFTLAGTRFVNLDTAADFFPAQAGLRGKLFQELQSQRFDGEHIYFTHSPLKDPRPQDDHEVGGVNEVDWLIDAIKAIGNGPLLTGHVHHSAELDFKGIHQFTIGEGLGHEDLVLQRRVAKLMLATVETGKPMVYSWADLNMPWSEHRSPTHAIKLARDNRLKQLKWYNNTLKDTA